MFFYTVQALLLSIPLLLLARSKGKFNTYSVLYAMVWTTAVIIIRLKFGTDQTSFYSTDQQTQIEMYERLISSGLSLAPQPIIADRYLIIIPVRLLSLCGIDPVLAMKFFQAVCLLSIYRICAAFLILNGLTVRLYHSVFFAGPLFIFLSTLGLRDLEIALAATYFFIGSNIYLKQLSLFLLIPLRPHLAVALIFGWLVVRYFKKFEFKSAYLVLSVITFLAFAVGGYGYTFGRNMQSGNAFVAPEIFHQDIWWRFLSNLVGLQFLTFDDQIVSMSIINLLFLRLFFVDSFLIPICFIFTLMAQKIEHSKLRLQVFLSFTFFLGLATQTEFNSTRQNLSFLSTMGVLALLGLMRRNDEQVLKKEISFSTS